MSAESVPDTGADGVDVDPTGSVLRQGTHDQVTGPPGRAGYHAIRTVPG